MKLAVSLAAALALLAAGCGGENVYGEAPATTGAAPPATTQAPGTAETQPMERTTFLVYFARGERLGVASRSVAKTEGVGAAALTALLAGPSGDESGDAGLGSEIPAGTRLLGLSIAGGVATVDLSHDFESGGGSVSMLLRVAQVVFTLTQFPTVERVRFSLDGEPAAAIGGEGVVVDPPIGRREFEGQAPAILVESPAPFERVTSPLRIRGSANVFEATFGAEIADGAGSVLAEKVVTATSGTGERGTFDAELSFEPRTPGRLVLTVFTYSAKDGSRQDAVEIPLELAP